MSRARTPEQIAKSMREEEMKKLIKGIEANKFTSIKVNVTNVLLGCILALMVYWTVSIHMTINEAQSILEGTSGLWGKYLNMIK